MLDLEEVEKYLVDAARKATEKTLVLTRVHIKAHNRGRAHVCDAVDATVADCAELILDSLGDWTDKATHITLEGRAKTGERVLTRQIQTVRDVDGAGMLVDAVREMAVGFTGALSAIVEQQKATGLALVENQKVTVSAFKEFAETARVSMEQSTKGVEAIREFVVTEVKAARESERKAFGDLLTIHEQKATSDMALIEAESGRPDKDSITDDYLRNPGKIVTLVTLVKGLGGLKSLPGLLKG